MAIRNRRGPYGKLDKTKLLPGEYAIVLQDDPFCKDGKSVYICFHAGDTKRMATFEDMQENIEDITDEIEKEFTEEIRAATESAKKITAYIEGKLENGDFNGPQGPQGIPGTDGAKGEKGDTGAKGDTGPVGPEGPQGATGKTGPQGPQGIQGEKGDKGDKGDKGESGVTTPVSGFISLACEQNGDLYVYYQEGTDAPEFGIDGDGNMYYVTSA